MHLSRRSLRTRAAAGVVLAALCATGSAQEAPAPRVPHAALDESLRELVDDPAAPPMDVFLILREQPAADVARSVRPAYEARVAETWRPVREALARIQPLLPSRAERAEMPVARQIALENELLRPDERETRSDARREVARLLAEMRATILAEAWVRCAPVQQRIASHVEGLPQGEVLVRTSVLNALVVRVRPQDLPTLLRVHPEIARVAPSGVRRSFMDVSAPVIGADDWTGNSIDGSGQRVAIVDTGVDGSHPALTLSDGSSVVVAAAVRLSNGASQSNFNDSSSSTDDLHGHGTHIAGTIASQDSTYGGVAPGAPVMNAKCFYRTTSGGGSGTDPDIIAATDWAIANGAAVLSLSFGGTATTDGSQALTRFYDAVVDVTGTTVAVAAGNAGSGTSTVLSPGDAFNAVTVGAFDDRNTTSLTDDRIAGFSSRGPTDDDRRKPDLAGPGVSIRSANNTWEGSSADFVTMSGTSMATPHVAAAMALLLDHESNWRPEALKALLVNSTRNTSPAPSTPDQAWGHGGLDLSRAYTDRDRVESATMTSTGTDTLWFALDNVVSGDRATLVWNRDVAFSSSTVGSGAGAARSLVDLDLFLYDEDGTEDDASESADDPIEQVKATGALGDGVLKVERVGSFPSGQTSLDLSVACAAALTPAQPPALSIAVSAPTDVRGGTQVTLTATVSNDGGLPAIAPAVALAVPTGWTLSSSTPASRTLSDLAADTDATVTWQVTAPAATGTGTFSVDADSTCWGETFDASTEQASVRADVTPPTVSAGPDVDVFAQSPLGRDLALRATGSDDSGRPVLFEWDTDGDGDFTDEGGSAPGHGPVVQLAIGTHTIGLRGTDHVGNSATDEVVVRVLDNPPDAVAGQDVVVAEGTAVELDGSASGDVEGGVTYAWDLGDGTTLTGAQVQHAYGDQGTYTVVLTVTDEAAQSSQDTLVVTVENADPIADAGPDRVVGEGREVTLLGSGSDPGVSDLLTFAWDLGDGATGSGADVTHAYREDGTYTATLTVTDDDGATATDTVVVQVVNLPPEVEAGEPLEIDEGDTVVLSGTAVDPGVDDTMTFVWTIGGAPLDGAEVSYTFERDGNVRAYLAVTDDDGDTGYDSVFVVVHNVPPTVSLPEELTVSLGSTLVHDLEPWDASPTDRAGLRTTWRVLRPGAEGDDAVVAEGEGPVVRWTPAERLRSGVLEVTVADDDVQVVSTCVVGAVTPPVADSLRPVLDADLDPKLEKKLLKALVAAHERSLPGASRKALRKAQRSVAKARKLLAGGTLPAVDTALVALEEDLGGGIAPPRAPSIVVPVEPGGTADLLAALPGAGFEPAAARRVGRALLKLRDAERRGRTERKIAKLRAAAAKAGRKLPEDAAGAWFRASLAD